MRQQPGRAMAVTALVLTPPLFLVDLMRLVSAALAAQDAAGHPTAVAHARDFDAVAPWAVAAWLGSLPLGAVLVALLPWRRPALDATRGYGAVAQLGLLLLPVVLLTPLPG